MREQKLKLVRLPNRKALYAKTRALLSKTVADGCTAA
jgi:hypothetical protein